MPQDDLFNLRPRFTGIRLTAVEVPTEGGYAYNLTVERRHHGDDWATCWAERWSGHMLDLCSTLAEDVMAAYLDGQDRDVPRAAASVHKVARAHARRHDRV